jgi:AbrB family looped-hinge helix DNA binding protein
MELAKVTAKGQITIPVQVRKQLGVKDGDKVVFWNDGNKIIIENSTRLALQEVQSAFEGLADELGLETEEDVVKLCKEVRKEMREKNNANNG